jgi:segregation and condensation protein A
MILNREQSRKSEGSMSNEVKLLANDPSAETQPYHVKLEVFEGPLDLLLHLIEKQELDITKVSLAAVTDQYLEYIQDLERISAENLAEFLVVAAKLLLIKSRALLPAPPEVEEEEEDLGEELAMQLQEYKKFKEAAQQLRDREEHGLHAYVRIASLPRVERELDLTDVSLDDLLAAVREALTLQPPAEPVNGVVAPIAFSVSDKIQDIKALLSAHGSFSFNSLLHSAVSRAEVIVTFLALLELIKGRQARVQQSQLFGEILVFSAEEPPPSPTQEPPQQ